jgi:hypothetical protein
MPHLMDVEQSRVNNCGAIILDRLLWLKWHWDNKFTHEVCYRIETILHIRRRQQWSTSLQRALCENYSSEPPAS